MAESNVVSVEEAAVAADVGQQPAPSATSAPRLSAVASPVAATVAAVVPAVSLQHPFLDPPEKPTQEGPEGIRFDFNGGCRVLLPEGDWRLEIRDQRSDALVFADNGVGGKLAYTLKRYFVPFGFRAWRGARTPENLVLDHTFDLRDRKVLIQFPVGTLGDLVGWFPYAVKFQREHGCRMTCSMAAVIADMFRDSYPEIEFLTPEEVDTSAYYATYNIGLFFEDPKLEKQPCDFRFVGLHRTAGYILGVDPTEERPKVHLPDDTRPIPEKYVCIAVQASTQCKYWNYPDGWRQICAFLRDHGYRVVCIDKQAAHGTGHVLSVLNQIPNGCEDQTGDRPLAERARWLKHADFFIGLSSGLSWLAWAMETPVVMISGFTHPTNEFDTPYRVINYHSCNSCWNDQTIRFNHQDFNWCPRKAGTPDQFVCSRSITPEQVKQVIKAIPGFGT